MTQKKASKNEAEGTKVNPDEGLTLPDHMNGGGETAADMHAGALPGAEYWLHERFRELGALVGSQSHSIHEMEREEESLVDAIDGMAKKLESVRAELATRRKVREANQTALDFVTESIKRIQEEGKNNGRTEGH